MKNIYLVITLILSINLNAQVELSIEQFGSLIDKDEILGFWICENDSSERRELTKSRDHIYVLEKELLDSRSEIFFCFETSKNIYSFKVPSTKINNRESKYYFELVSQKNRFCKRYLNIILFSESSEVKTPFFVHKRKVKR